MPFATNAITVVLTVDDDGGQQSTHEVFLDPAIVANQDYAALNAYAVDFAAVLAGVSNGRVARYSINISAFDAAAAAADAASNVERKAIFVLEAQGGEVLRAQVPSPDDALVDANDFLNITDGGVVEALADFYANGNGTLQSASRRGNAILRTAEAYQYHTKSHFTKRRRQG